MEYLERLARDESDLWKSVHDNIQTKKIKGYDEAIVVLQRLKELAEHRTCLEAFERRVSEIYSAYPRLSGLRWRLKAGKVCDEVWSIDITSSVVSFCPLFACPSAALTIGIPNEKSNHE